MIDVNSYFVDIASVAGLVVLVTGWLNTHLLKWSDQKAQLLSWAVSIALAFGANWQGLGLFAETDLLWTILQGIGAGLVANGIFKVELVKSILQIIKAASSKKS